MDGLFDLLENTGRSVFLTGKAGTGKTTFLNDFVSKTRKKHIIVAPTGIAAINAGGVTIHSMFGLPLRNFVPTTENIDRSAAMNIPDLMPHFKYRKDKLKLLREVEIIIIDEVSMLRADVLDMMDLSLRHVRRNPRPFGGAQMLFIGDLYQLPPVVREDAERVLSRYYPSLFFFEAYALRENQPLTVELTKIYRQTDEHFVSLLNAIRNSTVTEKELEALNRRYQPDFEPGADTYVYLCSHNRMADAINQKKLNELGGNTYRYKADVSGSFSESQYPNDEELELKIGAQVMFIRNDTSTDKKYFNGKLAEVSELTDEKIKVILADSDEEITLSREKWEQKRYFLDGEKKIQEEILGSYEQFPIRLAWAVTIHKSQGLTFDRLIVDAGKSFASGQVYVALSRCRTLDGIVLKSKITPDIIFSDKRIAVFHRDTHANAEVKNIVEREKYDFSIGKIIDGLQLSWLKRGIDEWYAFALASRFSDKKKLAALNHSLIAEAENLNAISQKFSRILRQMTVAFVEGETPWTDIEAKAEGAVNFFYNSVTEKIFEPLKDVYAESKGVKGLKAYNESLQSLLDEIADYLERITDLHLLDRALFKATDKADLSVKVKKKPTHLVTYALFEDGKSPGEIAKERGLVTSTVYGHLAKVAETGLLDIGRLFPQSKIDEFRTLFATDYRHTLNDWKVALPDFEYHELRILLNYFLFKKKK